MANRLGECLSSSSNNDKNGDAAAAAAAAGNFECHICFDLPQDPIVTQCGHLFCWPCLYKWLQSRSHSQKKCPVCNVPVEEEKLVPVYGQGRSKSTLPEINIPNRPCPTGQRPETVSPQEAAAPAMHADGDLDLFDAVALMLQLVKDIQTCLTSAFKLIDFLRRM